MLPAEGEEPPFTRRVSFEECDDTGRRNVTRTELLVFKSFSEQKDARPRGVADEKLIEIIETSPTALFASEIAEEAGISRKRASGILFRLTGRTPPLVMRKGWRRRTDSPRTELMFSRGYLYYSRLDQLKARLAERDVLGGQKQALYDRIRRNTEVDRQFTELVGLARELNVYSKTVADALEEVASVYTDLRKEVIAGSTYYYLEGVLNDEEAEREREFAKARKSGMSSYKSALGRAHEEFCQFAVDEMMMRGDFRVGEDCWWTEVVGRDGRRIPQETKLRMVRLRKWQTRSRLHGSDDRNLVCAMGELDRLAERLHVSRAIKEQAAVVYRRALKEGIVRGRSISAIVAASLYIACRDT